MADPAMGSTESRSMTATVACTTTSHRSVVRGSHSPSSVASTPPGPPGPAPKASAARRHHAGDRAVPGRGRPTVAVVVGAVAGFDRSEDRGIVTTDTVPSKTEATTRPTQPETTTSATTTVPTTATSTTTPRVGPGCGPRVRPGDGAGCGLARGGPR